MIMLVTTSPRARECAAAMEQATHQKTEIAASLARAVERLQSNDYDLLVLDESFNHTEIGGVNLLLSHAGPAMPVYVNLALHGTERVAREVQSGLARFVRERTVGHAVSGKPAAQRSAGRGHSHSAEFRAGDAGAGALPGGGGENPARARSRRDHAAQAGSHARACGGSPVLAKRAQDLPH